MSLKPLLSIEMSGFSIQREVLGVHTGNFNPCDSLLTSLSFFYSSKKGEGGEGGIMGEGVQSLMLKTEAWLNRPPCNEKGSIHC